MRDLQVQVVEPEASRGGTVVEKRSISQWSIRPTRAIPAGQAVVLRFSYAGGEESGPRFYIGPEGSSPVEKYSSGIRDPRASSELLGSHNFRRPLATPSLRRTPLVRFLSDRRMDAFFSK
jgi:hypothetical protein